MAETNRISPELRYANTRLKVTKDRTAWKVTVVVVVTWILADAIVLIAAFHEGGTGAFGILLMGAIAVNGPILVVALALCIWVGSTAETPVAITFVVVVVLPPAILFVGSLILASNIG